MFLHRKCLSIAIIFAPAVFAANQCVNPGGTAGCKSSINAAIAAAGANDTVTVAHGTYAENVIVNKPLALLGDNTANTTIEAIGLANGINIDGLANSGLSHVVVSGFTVADAKFQGILVTNASDITITNNHVTGNNRNLLPFNPRRSHLSRHPGRV